MGVLIREYIGIILRNTHIKEKGLPQQIEWNPLQQKHARVSIVTWAMHRSFQGLGLRVLGGSRVWGF